MSTKHPWHANIRASRSISIYDEDGNHIAVVDAPLSSPARHRREHDALLIAAAPELLEALQAIVALDDGGNPDLWHFEAEFDAARAAISKAIGEAK